MTTPLVLRAIVRVTEAGPLQWRIDLDCGHSRLVTRAARPLEQRAACETCRAVLAKPSGA